MISHHSVYIGDDVFDPVWQELNKRGATVHLHVTQTPSSTPYPNEALGLPVTEVGRFPDQQHRPGISSCLGTQ